MRQVKATMIETIFYEYLENWYSDRHDVRNGCGTRCPECCCPVLFEFVDVNLLDLFLRALLPVSGVQFIYENFLCVVGYAEVYFSLKIICFLRLRSE